MADEQGTTFLRKGREGSRWINYRPSSEEVADWWRDVVNPTLHDDLADKDRYLSGIMLVQNQETVKHEIVGEYPDGRPKIAEVNHIVFTPYPKVDVRIQYFWDLMDAKAEDWLGVIEPIGGGANGLPPGFRLYQANGGSFICCTMKVTVYERSSVEVRQINERGQTRFERTGKAVIDPAPATKMIPAMNRFNKPDEHALMKAETGAVGRALGMAGMLVIAGAGVATAEDVHEAINTPQEAPPESGGQAQAPDPEKTEDELRAEAAQLVKSLKENYPEKFNEFKEWAAERQFGKLSETHNPGLRSMVKQLQRKLDEASVAEADVEPESENQTEEAQE